MTQSMEKCHPQFILTNTCELNTIIWESLTTTTSTNFFDVCPSQMLKGSLERGQLLICFGCKPTKLVSEFPSFSFLAVMRNPADEILIVKVDQKDQGIINIVQPELGVCYTNNQKKKKKLFVEQRRN